MAERRHRARGVPPRSRLALLAGTAALGAIGVSVLAPSAQAGPITSANPQAALILAAESLQKTAAHATRGTDSSAQAASAVEQNKARAQALAAPPPPPPPPPNPAVQPKPLPAGPDGYRAYAASKVSAAQFNCLDLLWKRESGWRPNAQNPSSTAYGIPQLLDSTWQYTGIAKTSDGFRQVDAGLAYLKRAYPGGPCEAWAHSEAVGWY